PVVTGNAFLWRPRRRTRRRVHTAFLRRQFRCHVPSVAFWSQLRGCLVYWQRASPCALGRVPPPADEPPAAGSLSTGGPAAVIVRVARWPRVVPGGRGQGRGSRGTGTMACMAGLDVSVEGSSAPGIGAALAPPTQLQPESRYLNRELSTL